MQWNLSLVSPKHRDAEAAILCQMLWITANYIITTLLCNIRSILFLWVCVLSTLQIYCPMCSCQWKKCEISSVVFAIVCFVRAIFLRIKNLLFKRLVRASNWNDFIAFPAVIYSIQCRCHIKTMDPLKYACEMNVGNKNVHKCNCENIKNQLVNYLACGLRLFKSDPTN